ARSRSALLDHARSLRRRQRAGLGPRDRSRPASLSHRRVQRWLAAAVQVQRMTVVPLAVPALLTSRHRPDCRPTIVPSALNVHCWLVPPLQSHSCAFAPAVADSGASRHLPRTCRLWPATVQRWLAAPLQSQMIGCVPLAVLLFGMSRQRPDAALTSANEDGGGSMVPPESR